MPIGRHRDVAQLEARPGAGLDQGEHRQWPPMSSSRSGSASSSSSSSSTSDQSMTGFSTEPMPSISQRTRSPGSEEHRRVPEDADARRRPGGDDVARLERDRAADELDELGDAPDHVRGRAVLHQDLGAVVRAGAGDPPRPEAEGLGIRDLVGGDEDRAHRQERVGALGAQPLAVADLALGEGRRDALPVAGADVVDDHVARDVVERVRARDPSGPRADDDAELDLEVEGVGALRPDDRLAVADDRVGELREQERPGRQRAGRLRRRAPCS